MKNSTCAGRKPATKNTPSRRQPTRSELDQQAWQRKRQKKRRGNPPGSKNNAGLAQRQPVRTTVSVKDPRIGSKKPVPLITDSTAASVPQQAKNQPDKTEQVKPALSPKQELRQLEDDPRLDLLLDRLEAGDTLNDTDQHWLDNTLARIEQLMNKSGISDNVAAATPPKDQDIVRLLKGNY